MEWGLDEGRREVTLRIASALWLFWWEHGYWREGLEWLDKGWAGFGSVSDTVKARALTRIGWLAHGLGENARAVGAVLLGQGDYTEEHRHARRGTTSGPSSCSVKPWLWPARRATRITSA